MKLAIVGSRTFDNYELAKDKMKEILKINEITDIVSGGAKGADQIGEMFAKEFHKNMIIHLPEWGKYGRSAGMIRNKLIIQDADIVIAFWDGKSKGTKNSIDVAKKLNKECRIIYV